MNLRSLVLTLTLFALSLSAAAQIGVSPARFELHVGGRPTTESARVLNLGSQPVTVMLSVANWDLDENNQVRILPPDEQSLDQWIIVNPLQFTVPPGKTQTVRFSIRPRVEPAPGEHRAMLYFEQIENQDESVSSLKTRFRLGVAIYGWVGEVTHKGRLNGVEVHQRSAWLDITSDGSAHVRLRGQYAIWSAGDYPGAGRTGLLEQLEVESPVLPDAVLVAGPLPTTPVLPGTRRSIQLELDQSLVPGAYVLDLNGRLGEGEVDRGIAFTIHTEGTEVAVE